MWPAAAVALQPVRLTLWPARTRAEIVFSPGEQRGAQRLCNRLFGRPLAAWQYGGLAGAPAVVGPARPWLEAHRSFARALRAWRLGMAGPSASAALPAGHGEDDQGRPRLIVYADDVLAELVISADPDALADLRARALAPLSGLRPAQADRLTETLRSWLLHRGRREEVAADLFVHPQTVRYRMGQVRELLGDRLDDPRSVLELMIALGMPEERATDPAHR